jgi:hypothetical protein
MARTTTTKSLPLGMDGGSTTWCTPFKLNGVFIGKRIRDCAVFALAEEE